MKLEKAIEIKSRIGYGLLKTDPRDIGEANRLIIEAAKREISNRRFKAHIDHTLLPGETPE